jgi:hypothetical protein
MKAMLKKIKIKKHFEFYFSFLLIQIIGFSLVMLNAHNKNIQFILIILTSAIYALWSILHQYIHHNLTAKIVVEYVLIGVLGVSVSMFLL